MEDMDIKEENLQAAAQDEASRLVRQHQNELGRGSRKYNQHLRKGSHAQSQNVGPFETLCVSKNGSVSSASNSIHSSRSASGESSGSASSGSQSSTTASRRRSGFGRLASASSKMAGLTPAGSQVSRGFFSLRGRSNNQPGADGSAVDRSQATTSSVDSELNTDVKVPARLEVKKHNTAPQIPRAETRTSPFKRPSPIKTEHPSCLQIRMPPTPPDSGDSDASRPATRNGLEIRSADIRAATSGPRSRDRSPNLPTPNFASSRPDRPIVSFKPDYRPKDSERVKVQSDGVARVEAYAGRHGGPGAATAPAPAQREVGVSRACPLPLPSPKQSFDTARPLPTIAIPEDRATSGPVAPPSITVSPEIPTINVSDAPVVNAPDVPTTNAPDVRTINAPDVPSISISGAPTISAPAPSARPLPRPGAVAQGSRSGTSDGWSRASTPGAPREHARCTACGLPISGRTLRAAERHFHPGCFSCFACRTALEHVAFYLEPDAAREHRLAASDDGGGGGADEAPRFYCHLDFHEAFSPRCRSCKTPIEGEVVLACGGEWHVGHFFCAECGDPFDADTPFVEKDGYAWCVGCHVKRFSGKCAGCRRPVTERVVGALGREWHEECFCCKVSPSFGDSRG